MKLASKFEPTFLCRFVDFWAKITKTSKSAGNYNGWNVLECLKQLMIIISNSNIIIALADAYNARFRLVLHNKSIEVD